jgi:hypothetical protein
MLIDASGLLGRASDRYLTRIEELLIVEIVWLWLNAGDAWQQMRDRMLGRLRRSNRLARPVTSWKLTAKSQQLYFEGTPI